MKNIIIGILIGSVSVLAVQFLASQGLKARITERQLAEFNSDEILKAIEIDGTIVSVLRMKSPYDNNPPTIRIAAFHDNQDSDVFPYISLRMIEGEWEFASAGNSELWTLVHFDESKSPDRASINGSKYIVNDQNFDGFIDERRTPPIQKGAPEVTEYFTSDSSYTKAKGREEIIDSKGAAVDLIWTESGYELK